MNGPNRHCTGSHGVGLFAFRSPWVRPGETRRTAQTAIEDYRDVLAAADHSGIITRCALKSALAMRRSL